MHDEHYMYRVQWPTLRRQLYYLCLSRHSSILLDALCDRNSQEQSQKNSLQTAVNTWRQAILAELAQKAHATDAWPGWAALIPLFTATERLAHDLRHMAERLCQEYSQGRTGTERAARLLY